MANETVERNRELPVPWLWPRAAYVHVPFCAHHCNYCDFAVVAGKDGQIDSYLSALECELATLGEPQPVTTLFLGGGTPTYLAPVQLEILLRTLQRWLPPEPGHEFSVEANPGSLSVEKIAVLAGHGVTRISLGAQSFQPNLLALLERDHAPVDVPRAVERARRHGLEVSLDLIFGIPGLTLQQWQADLQRALTLQVDHLSTYGLTYEKGTRLWKQRRQGLVQALDEETELAQYERAMEVLEAAGFEHYEISNFARPGKQCRHNLVYWANDAYFGFGLGAARYVHGRRETNTRDLAAYLRRALAGEVPTQQSEQLGPLERARETLCIQLRRTAGVERADFHFRTGWTLEDVAGAAIARHVEFGLLADDGERVRLTRRGRCLADAVVRDLL